MEGYFKLIPCADNSDVKYVTKLPATIGRTTTLGSNEGQQVSIGPTEPTLSRYHGIISWNAVKKCFECKCNSKNGMVVDRKVYRKHEIAPLALRSSIRMGSVKVSFVPANSAGTVGNFESEFKLQIKSSHNGCHKYSYYDLVDYAFKSGLLDDETKNIGLYQREIVDWIVNNVDGYSETVKKQNLNQGVYMTLSKFYLKLSQEDGRNRWLPRKRLADSETTDGAMDDEEDE